MADPDHDPLVLPYARRRNLQWWRGFEANVGDHLVTLAACKTEIAKNRPPLMDMKRRPEVVSRVGWPSGMPRDNHTLTPPQRRAQKYISHRCICGRKTEF